MASITKTTVSQTEIRHLQLRPPVASSADTVRKPLTDFFVGLQEIQSRQGWSDPLSKNIQGWSTKVLSWYARNPQGTTINLPQVKLQLDELTQDILVDFWVGMPLEVIVNQQGDVICAPMVDFAAEDNTGSPAKWHVWHGLMWNQYKWVFDDHPTNPFTMAPNFETSMKVHELARDILKLVAALPEEIYDYPLKYVDSSSTEIAEIDPVALGFKKVLLQFVYLQLIQGVLTQKHADAIVGKREEEARQVQAATIQIDKRLAQLKMETSQKIQEHEDKLKHDLNVMEQQRLTALEALKKSMHLEIQTANTQLALSQTQIMGMQATVQAQTAQIQQLHQESQNLRHQLNNALNDDDDSSCTIL